MLPNNRIAKCYTDGSFNSYNASWAFIIVNDKGEEIHREKGILEGDINSLWQIGGEMKAVENAIKWCKSNNYLAEIYYDFKGLELWISDMTRNIEKPMWRAKNQWTKEYRNFMIQNKRFIHKLIWVKAHNNDKWNEEVDKYAKIIP